MKRLSQRFGRKADGQRYVNARPAAWRIPGSPGVCRPPPPEPAKVADSSGTWLSLFGPASRCGSTTAPAASPVSCVALITSQVLYRRLQSESGCRGARACIRPKLRKAITSGGMKALLVVAQADSSPTALDSVLLTFPPSEQLSTAGAFPNPCRSCNGTLLTSATSAPGLGAPDAAVALTDLPPVWSSVMFQR